MIWRTLASGQYRAIQPSQEGILHSSAFPGLWLDPQALLNNDTALVLPRLRTGRSTRDHQDFVRRLAAAKK